MIDSLKIDGFRSLIDFNIELNEGLQVLVGANGAGKSNFVEFLDFLGELYQTDLDAAMAVAEGASSIFSRENHTRDNAHLRFAITGTLQCDDEVETQHIDKVHKYEIECHIRYNKLIPSIYINSEKLTFTHQNGDEISFNRKIDHNSGKYKSIVKITSTSKKLKRDIFAESARFYLRHIDTDINFSEFLSSQSNQSSSVIRLLNSWEPASRALQDLTSLRSIHVDPIAARKPSPVSREKGMLRNGENLALTIYKMSRGEYYGNNYWWIRNIDYKKKQIAAHKSIINWCRELNPNITSIHAELDLTEALLKPQVKFDFSDKSFSFNRASDGTIKWITLVTMLFSEDRYSVIEEPENFLHPRMQEGIINLSREVLDRKTSGTQIIMSTHSQTILDMCKPYEIIIFRIEDGRTVARRPREISHLEEILRESDFGVGHLYKMGALDA